MSVLVRVYTKLAVGSFDGIRTRDRPAMNGSTESSDRHADQRSLADTQPPSCTQHETTRRARSTVSVGVRGANRSALVDALSSDPLSLSSSPGPLGAEAIGKPPVRERQPNVLDRPPCSPAGSSCRAVSYRRCRHRCRLPRLTLARHTISPNAVSWPRSSRSQTGTATHLP